MTTYVNHPFRCFICIVTLMALLWLTIGYSFVHDLPSTDCAHHIALKKDSHNPGDAAIPFENNSEENAEVASGDVVSEFVKTDAEQLEQINIIINYNRHYTTRTFLNFCCDSVSPPPEISVC